MKKKILAIGVIAMLITMLVVLTGCGNKKGDSDNNKKAESVTEIGKLDLEVEDISSFSEDLAAIKKDGKWGYIDKKGNIVIDCVYEKAQDFSEGLAVVKKDGKCGYINNKGEVVIDFKYDSADNFSFGYGIGYIGRSKNIVVDKNGNEIINKSYSMLFGPISENLFIVVANDALKGYAIVDKDENVIIDGIAQASKKVDGLIAVKQVADQGNFWNDGKWGFIDEQGKLVIDYTYDFAESFVDGLAAVVKDKKLGYINTKGDYVIESNYNPNIADNGISEGIIVTYTDGKYNFFDIQGNFKFEMEKKSKKTSSDKFKEGMFFIANENDKYGFINKEGKLVIDYKYTSVRDFSCGLAKVLTDDSNFEFINKDGKTILAGKVVDKTSNSSSTSEPDVIISSSNSTNNNSSSNSNNSTSNSTESSSSKTSTSNNNSSSSVSTTAEGIKIGNTLVKYGTYNGDAAASGITLVLKSDGTCTYDGKNGNYSIGKHDFAQDSSSRGSEKDCIIIKTDYEYYYYPYSDSKLTDGGIYDFIYSGN